MSTVVFSRLIQPQFSFMFSNYSPSNVKTTMKAQIELDNLQLHPYNMSFYLSAIGPYRLTSGSIAHLLIKKSMTSADTTPIRIECDDIILNVDFLTGNDANYEYDMSKIPALCFPAESVEAELDTCIMKFNNVKLNINFFNKYKVVVHISSFNLYATDPHFAIASPIELRKMINQSGFAYNEFSLNIEKICILEKRPNFDELLVQFCEMMPIFGRYVVKKRGQQQNNFNTSEIDAFFQKDLVLSFDAKVINALLEISTVYNESYKKWDSRKRLFQVCSHVPSMLSFFSRITVNLQSFVGHITYNDIMYDLVLSKGTSFSSIHFADCLFVWRNIFIIPPFELFVNGEQIIKAFRSTKALTIPQTDPIPRIYLNPKGNWGYIEKLSNSKSRFCKTDAIIPGKLFFDASGEFSSMIKNLFTKYFGKISLENMAKGTVSWLEYIARDENGKKAFVDVKNINLDLKEENGKVKIAVKSGKTTISPFEDEENEGKIEIDENKLFFEIDPVNLIKKD